MASLPPARIGFISIILLLYAHWHYYYLYPPQALVGFIQTVTVTHVKERAISSKLLPPTTTTASSSVEPHHHSNPRRDDGGSEGSRISSERRDDAVAVPPVLRNGHNRVPPKNNNGLDREKSDGGRATGAKTVGGMVDNRGVHNFRGMDDDKAMAMAPVVEPYREAARRERNAFRVQSNAQASRRILDRMNSDDVVRNVGVAQRDSHHHQQQRRGMTPQSAALEPLAVGDNEDGDRAIGRRSVDQGTMAAANKRQVVARAPSADVSGNNRPLEERGAAAASNGDDGRLTIAPPRVDAPRGGTTADHHDGDDAGIWDSDHTPSPVAAAAAPGVFNAELAQRRISAKHHMVCPLQMYVDYPLSYWLAVSGLGMAFWPGMTPNLISLIHPLCGLAAGILIWRSAPRRNQSQQHQQQRDGPGTPMKDDCDRGAPGMGAAADAAAMSGSSLGPQNLGGGVGATSSSASLLVAGNGATNGMGASNQGGSSSAVTTEDYQPSMLIIGSPVGSPDGNSGGLLSFPSSSSMMGKKSHDTAMQFVNTRTLRWGAFLFALRNILDTLDGVMARTQSQHKMVQVATLGFNGHTIDVVTDTLGCFFGGIGIILFLWQMDSRIKGPAIAGMFHRLGMSERNIHRNAGRLVVILGMFFVGFQAILWEFFMVRFVNLFDVHVWFHPELIEWDESVVVRWIQFGFAVISGDSFYYFLIFAMFFNKTWEAVQLCFFVGYPLLIFHGGFALSAWYFYVLPNPAVASLMKQIML